MELLCGWKEIAEYLHLTVRTAQRWESAGLPVHRAYESQRSPVLASQDELEQWVNTRQTRAREHSSELRRRLTSEFRELRGAHHRTVRKTRKLLTQVTHLGNEQQRLILRIRASLTSPTPLADAPQALTRTLNFGLVKSRFEPRVSVPRELR